MPVESVRVMRWRKYGSGSMGFVLCKIVVVGALEMARRAACRMIK